MFQTRKPDNSEHFQATRLPRSLPCRNRQRKFRYSESTATGFQNRQRVDGFRNRIGGSTFRGVGPPPGYAHFYELAGPCIPTHPKNCESDTRTTLFNFLDQLPTESAKVSHFASVGVIGPPVLRTRASGVLSGSKLIPRCPGMSASAEYNIVQNEQFSYLKTARNPHFRVESGTSNDYNLGNQNRTKKLADQCYSTSRPLAPSDRRKSSWTISILVNPEDPINPRKAASVSSKS